jgi:hypothetical protein
MPKIEDGSGNDNNQIWLFGVASLSSAYSVIVAVFVLLVTFNPYPAHVSRGISQAELALSIEPPTTESSGHTVKPHSPP